MMKDKDSMGRALGVAALVALFCSLMVTLAVQWLRPYQEAWASLESHRALLRASGLVAPAEPLSDREAVAIYLRFERRIVDLELETFADFPDAESYDYRQALDGNRSGESGSSARSGGGLASRPRYMPVWLLVTEGRIERLVLPVYGNGMWSTIHGYVGLGPDLATVTGASFYEHGETPGIGDRIQDPAWLAQWQGLSLRHGRDGLSFRIGNAAPGQAERTTVDAISGATVTVTALEKAMQFWFGPEGYQPFLDKLREGAEAP